MELNADVFQDINGALKFILSLAFAVSQMVVSQMGLLVHLALLFHW